MENWDSLFNSVGVESVTELIQKSKKGNGLVPVQKQITRGGTTFTTTVWTRPDEEQKHEKKKKKDDDLSVKISASKIQEVLRPIRKELGTERYKDYLIAQGITWERNTENDGADTLRASMAAKKFLEAGGRLDKDLFEEMKKNAPENAGDTSPKKPKAEKPKEATPKDNPKDKTKDVEPKDNPKDKPKGVTIGRGEKVVLGDPSGGKKEAHGGGVAKKDKPVPEKASGLNPAILDLSFKHRKLQDFLMVLRSNPELFEEFDKFSDKYRTSSLTVVGKHLKAFEEIKKEALKNNREAEKRTATLTKKISKDLSDAISMSENAYDVMSNARAMGGDTLNEFRELVSGYANDNKMTDMEKAIAEVFKTYKNKVRSETSKKGVFSSHKEGYEAIKRDFPSIKTVNFSDMPLEAVENVHKSMADMNKKYPGFASVIGSIGSSKGLTDSFKEKVSEGSMPKGAADSLVGAFRSKRIRAAVVTFQKDELQKFNTLYLNSSMLSTENYDDSSKKFLESSKQGWTVLGDVSDPVRTLVTHELHHAVHNKMVEIFGVRFNAPLRNLYKNVGKQSIKNNISEYASASFDEFIAEALTDYELSKKPSDLSKSVGEYFEMHAKEMKRKNQ